MPDRRRQGSQHGSAVAPSAPPRRAPTRGAPRAADTGGVSVTGIRGSSVSVIRAARWSAGTSSPTTVAIRRASSAASAPGRTGGGSRRTPRRAGRPERSSTTVTRPRCRSTTAGRSIRGGSSSRCCQKRSHSGQPPEPRSKHRRVHTSAEHLVERPAEDQGLGAVAARRPTAAREVVAHERRPRSGRRRRGSCGARPAAGDARESARRGRRRPPRARSSRPGSARARAAGSGRPAGVRTANPRPRGERGPASRDRERRP